jgi:hypothetical protein
MSEGGFGLSYAAGAGADTLRDIIREKVADVYRRQAFEAQQQQRAEQARQWELQYQRQLAADKGLADSRAAEAERDRAAATATTAKADAVKQFISDPSLPPHVTKWLQGASLGYNQLTPHDYEDPAAHRAHLETENKAKRDAEFSEFKRRTDYTEGVRQNRPRVGRLVYDDPTLPNGVQKHLTEIRQRNPDFNSALGELQNSWAQHQQAHPNASPLKAVRALQQLYSGAGRPGANDDDLDQIIDAAMPGGGGAPGAGLGANGPYGPGANVPNSNGQSEAQLQQRAAAVLQQLGKDASPESVQRFLSNPQNRSRLIAGGQ